MGRGPARQVPTPPNIGADSVSPRGACCRVASNIDWNPGFSPSPLRGDFTATLDPTIDVTGRVRPLLAYSVEKLRSKQNRLVFAEYSRTRDIQNLG